MIVAYKTKSTDILEAELHAHQAVLFEMFRLIKEENATAGALAGKIRLLLDNAPSQQVHLSEEGIGAYTKRLQHLLDALSPPFT